jgi:hypothetical protein
MYIGLDNKLKFLVEKTKNENYMQYTCTCRLSIMFLTYYVKTNTRPVKVCDGLERQEI